MRGVVFRCAMTTLALALCAGAQCGRQEGEVGFDDGGTLVIGPGEDQRFSQDVLPSVRDFLWTHYHTTRTGAIRVWTTVRNGDQALSVFVVEKDERGQWVIAIGRRPGDRRLEDANGPDGTRILKRYPIVERIRVVEGRDTSEVISPEEAVDPRGYRLRLSGPGDEDGLLW